jgi:protein O-mannosyl-transferase
MKGPRTTAPPTARPEAPRPRRWVAPAALCALTLLAWASSFGSGFVLDNRGLILEDTRLREASARNLALILDHTYWWPYGESGLYRPFTTLTYLFNYSILGNGANPAGYHAVNLLLHACNVLLVFALARRLIRDVWPAFFVAALWAVHPVLTESVTNIVGRADLLAGMALLAGLLMYLKSAEMGGWRRWAWVAGLAGMTAVGLFSKESAAAILGVIIFYELTWWKGRERAAALAGGCAAVLAALGWMWYQRAAVFSHLPPASFPFWDNPIAGADFWTAKLTALKVIAKYLGLLVWPARLSSDYSYAQIPLATGSAGDWLAWMAVAAVAASTALAWRYQRALFFLAGMAFLTFLPASNLLFPIGTIMAERLLYLPAIAASAAIVLAAYEAGRRARMPRLAPVVLCVVALALTARTWARNADWHDDVSLSEAAVEVSPNSFKSHRMLAAALYEAGGGANIDRAIAEADRALAILSALPDARSNPDAWRRAGDYYAAKGDLLRARGSDPAPAYRKSLTLLLRARAVVNANYDLMAADARARGGIVPERNGSRIADLEAAISAAYLNVGDAAGAYTAASVAAQLDPFSGGSYRQLAASLLAGGRPDDAAVALAEGGLVTADGGLRQMLLGLYRQGLDREGCALVPGAAGPALNLGCPTVRRHLCAAVDRALELYRRVGRKDLADQLIASGVKDSDCLSAGSDNR